MLSEGIPSKKGKLKTSTFVLSDEECETRWAMAEGKPALVMGVSPETLLSLLQGRISIVKAPFFQLDAPNQRYVLSRFLYKMAIEYYVCLVLENEVNDGECFVFDEDGRRIIEFVRKGNREKKYLTYETKITEPYIPFETETQSIKFHIFADGETVFVSIELFKTLFTLNMSDPTYNQ